MSGNPVETLPPPIIDTREFASAGELSRAGIWEKLSKMNFPYMAENTPILLAQYRIHAIKVEVTTLQEYVPLIAFDNTALGLLRGRMKAIQTGAAETIIELFNGKVEPIDDHDPVEFTRDDAAWIELINQTGAVDLLRADLIPSLKNLSVHEINQMKFDALKISYAKWKDNKEFDFDEKVDTGVLRENIPNPFREYAKEMQAKIAAKMIEIANEGLALLNTETPAPAQV